MAVDVTQRALAAQHNADIPARKNAEASATHATDPAAEELVARAKAKREQRAAQSTTERERPGHSVTVPTRKNPALTADTALRALERSAERDSVAPTKGATRAKPTTTKSPR
ncbi:MAG: hypothetical protein H0V63_05580 [Burkholderiaceae bacterium]|nr:hypothetical protein [Burkholderiaceae bacterium]